ncbi:MAG: hypothetical protein KatS3mg078_2205 [Deltaproteobacteria bacterium]|nr:MAG: hypothetical protein KatS3mg078_2205 [Deltaproteobacteria bacterium]
MGTRWFITILYTVVFTFCYAGIHEGAQSDERDELRKEIEQLRYQVEIMQRRLMELEEKSRLLEEKAKQRETKEDPGRVTAEVVSQRKEGFAQKFIGAFNPDISVVGTFAAAYFSEDEPHGRAEADPENTGINLQEIEVAFQGSVDPYFRFDSFFSIGRDGVETEEAYATTLLSLPLNLQVRAGIMRSKFGRINLQHRELQDFVTLPLPAVSFLGEHLNPVGVEFNFLIPLPWFLELSASVNSPEVEVATFDRDENANNIGRLLYIFHLSNFFELSDALSFLMGGSFATGSNGTEPGNRSNLYGIDLFAKYRPLRGNPYQELWLQSEFIYRQAEVPRGNLDDWGAYAQLVYRFAKRWNAGFRFDFVDTGDPIKLEKEKELEMEDISGFISRQHEHGEEESILGLFGREKRYAFMLTFNPTEFSRIRLQYEISDPVFEKLSHAVFLQFQYSIGPHGAHPF